LTYFDCFERRSDKIPNPTRPAPSSVMVPGSGVETMAVGTACAEAIAADSINRTIRFFKKHAP